MKNLMQLPEDGSLNQNFTEEPYLYLLTIMQLMLMQEVELI